MLSLNQIFFLVYAYILKVTYNVYHIFYQVKDVKVETPKPVYGEQLKIRFNRSFSGLDTLNDNIDTVFYNKKEHMTVLTDPDNELEKKWKTRILFESSPRGNVIMYYDAYKLGFAYYCDQYLPYEILNKIAMKYVLTFQCRDFFIDELERPEDNPSKIMGLLMDDVRIEDKPPKKKAKINDNGPFAKLKNYSNVSNKVDTNKGDEPVKDKMRNCFINRGKIANFSFIQKAVKKPAGFKTDMVNGLFENSDVQKEVFSYRDFKAAITKASS